MRTDRPGEFERIRDLVAALPRGEGVIVGPGDDAAVLRPEPGLDLVVTTDTFVEGRHFRHDLLDPQAIGRRLAAANLSDLAAMAARPRWATVAFTTSALADPARAKAIESACAAALAAEGAAIVGGNMTAADGPESFSVTLIGDVARGAHWTRRGARAGDVLAVTGFPGRAAGALAALTMRPAFASRLAAIGEAYVAPPCRVAFARLLAATGAVHAAIDISDGLAGDLAHLLEASGVGATIERASLPEDAALLELAALLDSGDPAARLDALRFGPSDDYELLLAIDPTRLTDCAAIAAEAGVPLHAIGTCDDAHGRARLRESDGTERALPGRGWDHFAG